MSNLAPRCPHCNEPCVKGERFCWYCSAELYVEGQDCALCGTPHSVIAAVRKLRRERRTE